jgi:predicted metal-binding membrane protein
MKPPKGPESSSSLRGRPSAPDTLLLQAFSALDKTALGVAVGALCALTVWGATVLLIAKGGPSVGPTLALLGQYFVGYTVTPRGSVVGALYGFLAGFLLGWITAAIRNVVVAIYVRGVMLRATLAKAQTFMDDL